MLKHLIQISDLTRVQIESMIERAQMFEKTPFPKNLHISGNQPVGALLFYENSTRTRVSFELAAYALSLKTINLDIHTSSSKKDESILDTIRTLGAMGCGYFVIRHSESGILAKITDALGEQFSFINAGDGQHAHPTQGLLDMLTLYQQKKSFDSLKVGILGDSIRSRVAKSDIAALQCLGCRDIRLIGPEAWLLPEMPGVTRHTDDTALEELDVIITLRVQKERMTHVDPQVLDNYIQQFQLNSERLKQAKPNVIVMHPGPINRGVEITSEVADGSQSMILKQVRNGVLIRMAVWEKIAKN